MLVSLMQSGVCGCERGYTEVMTTHGFLDYCTRTPGVDNNKKADVKTNSGRLKPGPSQAQDLFTEWTLRPVGPGTEMEIICAAQPVRSLVSFWTCLCSSRITRPGLGFLSRSMLSVGASLCPGKHYDFKEILVSPLRYVWASSFISLNVSRRVLLVSSALCVEIAF